MGRKGSKLIPFLKNALFTGKYINLTFVRTTDTFSLSLPRKSSSLGTGCQMILKDWYKLNNKKYTFSEDYTKAKQGMESALRKSDFLKRVQYGKNKKTIYKLLKAEEIKAKKLLKKAGKKQLKEDSANSTDESPSSVQSSGYGTGEDSPLPYSSDESDSDHALTHAVKHDENNYALLYALEHDHGNLIQTTNIIYPELIEPNSFENVIMSIARGPANEGMPVENEDQYLKNEDLHLKNEDQYLKNKDLHLKNEGQCLKNEDQNIENEDQYIENEDRYVENKDQYVESSSNPNVFSVRPMEMVNISLNSENFNLSLADIEGSINNWNVDDAHDNNFNDFLNGLSGQDSCMQDLNQLFHIDNFLIPSFENSEQILKNDSLLLDENEGQQKYMTEIEMSTTIGLPSFKTQQVYECVYCQQIPGMVLLTFQSKFMEICKADSNGSEPDSRQFIFDETTLKAISSCILLEEKVIGEEHLLLIFKRIS